MTHTEIKARELVIKMQFQENAISFEQAKHCALIAVDRNIEMFTKLVNRMEHFNNESRQVIYQLIDNEEEVKQEIEKL